MEIRWGNVLIALVIIFLLFNFSGIFNTVATMISSAVRTIGSAFDSGSSYSGSGQSDAFNLARLCVLLIFVLGALKLITNRRR